MDEKALVLEARVRLRHAGCFSERLPTGAHVTHVAAQRDADVFVMHGANEAQVESFLRDVGSASGRARVVSRAPSSVVVRVSGTPHPTAAIIRATGCSIVWPAVFSGGDETYSILAPGQDALDTLVRELQSVGRATVEDVSAAPPEALSVDVPLAQITTSLTERQLDVLQRAIGEGYYDSPRRTSTEALAVTFGVTRSTLEEHLRKAERRVLEGFAAVLIAQPVIARAATRRPGRPAAGLKPLAPR